MRNVLKIATKCLLIVFVLISCSKKNKYFGEFELPKGYSIENNYTIKIKGLDIGEARLIENDLNKNIFLFKLTFDDELQCLPKDGKLSFVSLNLFDKKKMSHINIEINKDRDTLCYQLLDTIPLYYQSNITDTLIKKKINTTIDTFIKVLDEMKADTIDIENR